MDRHCRVTVAGQGHAAGPRHRERYDAGGGASGELIEVAPVVPETSMEECTEANRGATVWETVSVCRPLGGVTYTRRPVRLGVVTATAGEGSR